jgi:hypothetical protein
MRTATTVLDRRPFVEGPVPIYPPPSPTGHPGVVPALYRIGCHRSPSHRTRRSANPRESSRAMGSDGLVTGVEALAKHKVAGSTPVTRSRFLGKSRTSEDRS